MPSSMSGNGINSSIAYSRWEPLEDQDEDETPGQNSTQMQEFQRFEESSNDGSSNMFQSRRRGFSGDTPSVVSNYTPWTKGIRIMIVIIIFGVGWIIGFLIRWGVHRYYVDSMGHCVVPARYSYSLEMSQFAQNNITPDGLRESFLNFTKDPHHRAGSPESHGFVEKLMERWKKFGLDKVDEDVFDVRVTKSSQKRPNKITIYSKNNTVLWSKSLDPSEGDKIVFSANAAGRGRLVYGHYGRISDFYDLQKQGLEFNDSIVLLKTSVAYDTGSVVRNAQIFGAKGVLLFPDPYAYILTPQGKIGSVPRDAVMSHSVKFVPGDPGSPYVDSDASLPDVPVISLSFEEASDLMRKYVNGYKISRTFWFELPIITNESRDFSTEIHVHNELHDISLRNVIGVIPGRFEPTRYIIIGCHHDTWFQGAAKPGLGHSVLMELVRTFGAMRRHGWQPGRSIIFASWDGEELGSLGVTSWIYRHAKELESRAVGYIDLDYLVRGSQRIHVATSPLFKNIVEEASKEVSNDENSESLESLYRIWINDVEKVPTTEAPNSSNRRKSNSKSSKSWTSKSSLFRTGHVSYRTQSPFQSLLGVSSIEISVKNEHSDDAYPYIKTSHDTPESVEKFLDPGFKNSVIVGKLVTAITMRLVTSAKLPIWASDYANEVSQGYEDFFSSYKDVLQENELDILDRLHSAEKIFQSAATNFHNTFRTRVPQLEFLEYHEYNDQLLELERAFLTSRDFGKPGQFSSPFKHVIRGPSPINAAGMETFPRLRASLELMTKTNTGSWEEVKKEAFYVTEALRAASCVLENHILLSNSREILSEN